MNRIGWSLADVYSRKIEALERELRDARIALSGYEHVTNHIRSLTGDYESVDIDFTVGKLLRERQVYLQRAEAAEAKLKAQEAGGAKQT